jgi:DNA (cytosine-5)-methyltransferase 1
MLSYVELFAGAGGLSLGLDRAGWHCVGHAEVNKDARAVLRYRWPDTPLYGDVSTLDGTQWRGVTLLSGGSPCQDLSVAGKRAGLKGSRSVLFLEQVRLWNESAAPLMLWENVDGALSSGEGKDFARVLSTILGLAVAVPRARRRGQRVGWASAGVVDGDNGVRVAWRVIDLQYFGVPQRRRRVFIVASRSARVCPAQVLLELDSDEWGRAKGSESRETDSRAAGNGSGERNARPLDAAQSVAFSTTASVPYVHADVMPTLPHLPGLNCPGAQMLGVIQPHVTFDARGNGRGDVVNTLAGDHSDRITDYTPLVVPTLTVGAHAAAPGLNGQDAQRHAEVLSLAMYGNGNPGRGPLPFHPRRLMPIETERLMSWPDGWTARGVDEQGREYALSDTARYRLVGNGVASVVSCWIGLRLAEALRA